MASRYEVEIKISSAEDLKNVNWRNGTLKPYAVVWVDPNNKLSTRVDREGDTNPYWDETLSIPLPGPVDEYTNIYIDIVHSGSDPDTKPLIGSARLNLRNILDDVGLGERSSRTLQLKRPSGRPQGKVDVKIAIREPYYHPPETYYAPPYGVPPPAAAYSRDYPAPPAYGNPYAAAPPPPPVRDPYYAAAPPPPPVRDPYYTAVPPSGYPNSTPYGQQSYGQDSYYGQPEEKKKSKFGGMGTGLAVGAVAGVLGGIALTEGAEYVEDKIEDEVTERVEDDLGYDGDDF